MAYASFEISTTASSRTLAAVLVGLLSSIWRDLRLRNHEPSIQEEAWIGWLTWMLLYVACFYRSRTRQNASEYSSSTNEPSKGLWSGRLTVGALSAAGVASLFARRRDISPLVHPVITLAIIIIVLAVPINEDTFLGLEAAQKPCNQDLQEPNLLERPISRLRIPLGVLVNLVLILRLAASVSYPMDPVSTTTATGTLFVVSQTAIFTLLPRLIQRRQSPPSSGHALLDWDLLERLSLYSTACFSCLVIYCLSMSSFPNLSSLSLTVTDSVSWMSLFFLCSEKLTTTATTFDTVASSFGIFMSDDGWSRLFPAAISCILSVWQSVAGIPPSRKFRNWLCILILIPLLRLGYDIHHRSAEIEPQRLVTNMHPVEHIVQNARREFSMLLEAQSKTVEQARKEYIRRYGREPPPNFDSWFELSIHHDFVLVDEFDSMMHAFEPFWGVAPPVLQQLVAGVHEQFSDFMVKYEVLNGKAVSTGGDRASWFSVSMSQLLPAKWASLLPDMTLAINTYDEPTVCAPRDTLDKALELAGLREPELNAFTNSTGLDSPHTPRFLKIGRQDSWEAITLSCPVDSPARNPICAPYAPKTKPHFVQNLTQAKDICEHCELQRSEGFLMAPDTLYLTHSLVPIWSQGKPSSFNDIVFPSPYYFARSSDYIESMDSDWDDKASGLYWVGAATGGYATQSNWKDMQRQRMVLMTHVESDKPVSLLRETEFGIWTPYISNMSELSSLFSTRIVGVSAQCEDAVCKSEKGVFGIGDEEVMDPPWAAYEYKLALDLDGNTFSGRFYRILQSKSAVIKQTVFEEWHDDRLMPWIHYVPVSTDFEELPELVRFLATTEKGDEIAAQIGQDGRDWAARALRQVDLQLVWLRMLLEYGRIVDQDRQL